MLGEPLKAAYERLTHLREPFLQRARTASAITIPTLVPPLGHTPTSTLPTPYQSLGARGVNNLAAKLLLSLLPPNQPFFKLAMDDDVREQLGASAGEADKALNKMERIIMADIESTAVRPPAFEALKHLVVAGNALTYDAPDGAFRVFPLSTYVCKRDPQGGVQLVILKECIAPMSVPESIREQVETELKSDPKRSAEKSVDLFTAVFRVGNRFHVWQEIGTITVPGSDGHYPLDKCPWNPMRFVRVDGEDYGRGYVEEFIGDLKSLEMLTRAMVHSAAAAAKVVYLVNPNGQTSMEDIEEAEGGDVKVGSEEDVGVLQLQKAHDFTFVENRIQRLTESLSYAFLLNSAIQRQADRVTAEEIRYMANELESQLGGVYSSLSQEFQLPLIRTRMANLQRKGKLPTLPKDMVKPQITTGVDAIGRGNDFDKLATYVRFLAEAGGPELVAQRLNQTELANRAAAGIGIEPDGLVKTEEEVAQEMQQQQMAAMQLAAVAPSINQAGQLAARQMDQPAQ